MKGWKKYLLLFLLAPLVNSEIYLSEIMFNPLDGNEWIEFYCEEKCNLTALEITDNYYTDELGCCDGDCSYFLPNQSYFLIFDKDTTINTSKYNSFCVDDNSIGNGLGNLGDVVVLSKNTEILVNFSYDVGTEKGNTLSLIEKDYLETVATPGGDNVFILSDEAEMNGVDLSLLLILPEKVYAGSEYSLFKIKNEDYPEFNEELLVEFYFNVSGPYFYEEKTTPSLKSYTTTDTGDYVFEESGSYLICAAIVGSSEEDYRLENNVFCQTIIVEDPLTVDCNISLTLETERLVYEEGEKLGFYNVLTNESFPFEITYWVEDLFGEVVKKEVITKNTNKKSYTPKIDERDRVFSIKSELTWVACNNSNKEVASKKLFIVKGKDKETMPSSEGGSIIEIKEVDKEIYFGDFFNVDLDIQKGDTSKYAIKVYVLDGNRKISEITTLHVKNKNQNYLVKLPILLNLYCTKKPGKYSLVVEGLDIIEEKTISVLGVKEGSCTKKIIETNPKTEEYVLLDYTKELTETSFAVVQITNPENKVQNYDVWTYLYDGPSSLSGEREKNREKIELKNYSSKIVVLQNNLEKEAINEIKLKVKIQKEDRKTPYEITKTISVINLKEEEQKTIEKNKSGVPSPFVKEKTTNNKITGETIYVSSKEKTKNISIYLLLFVVLLVVVGFWKLKSS